MSRKRAFPDDVRAKPEVEKIKRVRAPSRTKAKRLRVDGADTLVALDRLRRAIERGADNDAEITQRLGELRAHLNFIRPYWGLDASIAARVSGHTLRELCERYPRPVPAARATPSSINSGGLSPSLMEQIANFVRQEMSRPRR